MTSITFFYDFYETEYGDGFYPYLEATKHKMEKTIDIEFKNINGEWIQTTGDCIYGFDGKVGEMVLQKLNESISRNLSFPKIIKNKNKRVIFTSGRCNEIIDTMNL